MRPYLHRPLSNRLDILRRAPGGMPGHQPYAASHQRYDPAADRSQPGDVQHLLRQSGMNHGKPHHLLTQRRKHGKSRA